jgi:SAM-dependent methyltransferase
VSSYRTDVKPHGDDRSPRSGAAPTPAMRALIELFIPSGARCLEVSCTDSKAEAGPWLRGCGYSHVSVNMSETPRLPFEDESFDAALMIETLEHLVAPDLAAAEVCRVLNRGGVLLVTAPNISYWRRRLDLALSSHERHGFSFNPCSLRHVLQQAGFNLVGVEGQDGAIVRDLPLARRFWKGHPSALYSVAERLFPSLLGFRVGAFAIKA